MKKKTIAVIRWILTAVLIYGIYTEAGPWTAGAFVLLTITIEMISNALKNIIEALKELAEE